MLDRDQLNVAALKLDYYGHVRTIQLENLYVHLP